MRLNFPLVMVAVFVLAACSTAQQDSADTGGGGAAAAASSTSPQVAATTGGPIPGSQQDLIQNIGDRVFFDFDKFSLKPEARSTIERWAAWMQTYEPVTLIIQGHADERGTREYNLALGERRANSAKEFLVSLGVDPDRINIISFGKERPAVLGSNEEAWAQNRRGLAVVN